LYEWPSSSGLSSLAQGLSVHCMSVLHSCPKVGATRAHTQTVFVSEQNQMGRRGDRLTARDSLCLQQGPLPRIGCPAVDKLYTHGLSALKVVAIWVSCTRYYRRLNRCLAHLDSLSWRVNVSSVDGTGAETCSEHCSDDNNCLQRLQRGQRTNSALDAYRSGSL
jgi:hypothetical protein